MEELRLNFIPPAKRRYKVFAYGTPLRGQQQHIYIVDKLRRDQMIARDEAESVSGGKALRLKKRLYDLRGQSCTPSSTLIDRYVTSASTGRDWAARAVIDGVQAEHAEHSKQRNLPAVEGWSGIRS